MMGMTLLINLERGDHKQVPLRAVWVIVCKSEHMLDFLDFIPSGPILKGSAEQRLKTQTPELDSEFKSQPFHILLCGPGRITYPHHASVSLFVSEDDSSYLRCM